MSRDFFISHTITIYFKQIIMQMKTNRQMWNGMKSTQVNHGGKKSEKTLTSSYIVL